MTTGISVSVLNNIPTQLNFQDPLGSDFLYDMSTLDLDLNFVYVSGLWVLMQDITMRLITPTGSKYSNLPSPQYDDFVERDYGYSLIDLIGSSVSLNQNENKKIEYQIQQEITKDERVSSVQVKANYNFFNQTLTIAITVVAITNQTFSLVFTLTPNNVSQLVINLNPYLNN